MNNMQTCSDDGDDNGGGPNGRDCEEILNALLNKKSRGVFHVQSLRKINVPVN